MVETAVQLTVALSSTKLYKTQQYGKFESDNTAHANIQSKFTNSERLAVNLQTRLSADIDRVTCAHTQ